MYACRYGVEIGVDYPAPLPAKEYARLQYAGGQCVCSLWCSQRCLELLKHKLGVKANKLALKLSLSNSVCICAS